MRAVDEHAGPGFRPDIEGLRAVAILGVVLYHAGVPGFGGGFVGVDLFFVLSGFLITGLLVRELDRTGRVRLADFWARRVRRLLPAATLMLVTVAVAGTWAIAPCDRREAGLGVVAAAVYVANWMFVRRHLDYLAADDAPSPVLHTWSLGVEEQFYAVWPLLVVLLAAGAGGDNRAIRRRLLVGVGVVVVASLSASLVLTRSWQPFAFFGSPTRFWQLGAGAVLAIGTAGRDHDVGPRAAAVLGTSGLLGLAVAIGATDRLTEQGFGYPGVLAALPVGATLAIVLAGGRPWWGLPLLASAPMRWLGRLSYGWYLWHWPVLLLAPEGAGTGASLALAAVALGIAWATHHLVENPVRFSRGLVRAPLRSLALGALLTAVAVGAGAALRRNDLRRVEARALAGTAPYLPLQADARDDVPVLYENGCHLGFPETESPPCTFGEGRRRVVLFGDSHATNLFPALEAAAADAGWRVVARVKSSCSPATATLWDGRRRQPYHACDTWRERVLSELERDPPDLVVVATVERMEDRVIGPDGTLVAGDAAAPIWAEALGRTLGRLAATGAEVVFVRDNPRAPREALRCWSWAPLDWERCGFPRDDGPEANLDAARAAPGVGVLDLDDAVCRGGRCALVVDGTTVYRDTHHYTATFSRSLAPRLRTLLGG